MLVAVQSLLFSENKNSSLKKSKYELRNFGTLHPKVYMKNLIARIEI
jgi:hypothetical protein